MINHAVIWKFKDEALGNSKIENMKLLKEKLENLKGLVSEIVSIECSFNEIDTPSSYDFILNARFNNKRDLDAYIINEHHKKVGEFVREVIEKRVSIDYEV